MAKPNTIPADTIFARRHKDSDYLSESEALEQEFAFASAVLCACYRAISAKRRHHDFRGF